MEQLATRTRRPVRVRLSGTVNRSLARRKVLPGLYLHRIHVGRPTTPGRGEVGQTPGIAAIPRGRATFRGALPGVARPSGNEGAGGSPGCARGWGCCSGGAGLEPS